MSCSNMHPILKRFQNQRPKLKLIKTLNRFFKISEHLSRTVINPAVFRSYFRRFQWYEGKQMARGPLKGTSPAPDRWKHNPIDIAPWPCLLMPPTHERARTLNRPQPQRTQFAANRLTSFAFAWWSPWLLNPQVIPQTRGHAILGGRHVCCTVLGRFRKKMRGIPTSSLFWKSPLRKKRGIHNK